MKNIMRSVNKYLNEVFLTTNNFGTLKPPSYQISQKLPTNKIQDMQLIDRNKANTTTDKSVIRAEDRWLDTKRISVGERIN
jgi:hypothetical protein